MILIRTLRTLGATAALAAAALVTGLAAQTASAATFLETVDSDNARLQLAVTSADTVAFRPRFTGVQNCSTCGVPNTPPNLVWAKVVVGPNLGGVSLVNQQTNRCLDVAPALQRQGAQAVGSRVVLAACDGTKSQQWKVNIATGNSSSFQNALNGLMLTNSLGQAIFEPITVNNTLSAAERAKHIQRFGSTLVKVQS